MFTQCEKKIDWQRPDLVRLKKGSQWQMQHKSISPGERSREREKKRRILIKKYNNTFRKRRTERMTNKE